MKKVLTAQQIREIDACTIKRRPISSIDLMEQAALACSEEIIKIVDNSDRIHVVAGMGNNGGDGYAIARHLREQGLQVDCSEVRFRNERSPDCELNYVRLKELGVEPIFLNEETDIPDFKDSTVVIDAIFGSGLDRPVAGFIADIVQAINDCTARTISIDIPSGLFCYNNSRNELEGVINADTTLSFEFPKLPFLLPSYGYFCGNWKSLPIGLLPDCISKQETDTHYLTTAHIVPLLKPRDRFSHKGTYGHAVIMAGSKGKAGAALLATRAALRAGAGLVSACVPEGICDIVQVGAPEAMVELGYGDTHLAGSYIPDDRVIGIGPGIGMEPSTAELLHHLIRNSQRSMVLDADALNLLAQNEEWLGLLPVGSILTPHPKEFERLTGAVKSDEERLEKLRAFAKAINCIMVLKGAYSVIALPNGNLIFNGSGNAGMATGGSGDVLTGIITSLLAQGYSSEHASLIGVHLHGLAGDLAAQVSMEAMVAGDIIDHLGPAFATCRSFTPTD